MGAGSIVLTALHFAVNEDEEELVKLLLAVAGEKLFELLCVQDKYGRTALHIAVCRKNVAVVAWLFNAGGERVLELMDMRTFMGQAAID